MRLIRRRAHTADSSNELFEALAAGQRLIVSEQRQIRQQLDLIETTVCDTSLRIDAVERRMAGIETRMERADQRSARIETVQTEQTARISALKKRLVA